jgi:hypothetical protein
MTNIPIPHAPNTVAVSANRLNSNSLTSVYKRRYAAAKGKKAKIKKTVLRNILVN